MSKQFTIDNSLASIEECLEALEHRDRHNRFTDEAIGLSSQSTLFSPKYSHSTGGSEKFFRCRHDREISALKHDIDVLKSTFIEKTEHVLHLEALFQRALNQISLEIEGIDKKRRKITLIEAKVTEKLSNCHSIHVPTGVFPSSHKILSRSPCDFSFSNNEGDETSNFSFGQIDENVEVNLPQEKDCKEFEEFLKRQQSSSFHSDRALEEHEVMQLPYIFDAGLKTVTGTRIEPGSHLTEKYKVEKIIASTHFSTVLQCFDVFDRKKVCVKVIHSNKRTFDQGLDEIKIMNLLQKSVKGSLAQKNIVRLLEFFYYKESLHIVYELLGENLFVLNSNPQLFHIFQGEILRKIIKQVLIALSFIHSQGLIHADIKPENILLASPLTPRKSLNSFDVRLVDFGCSCYKTDTLTTYIQSVAYRAPEVIVGGNYDSKIDIWSLGCVLAELLTGEVLFEAANMKEMMTKVNSI